MWKWIKRITIVVLLLLVIALIAIRSPYVQSKLVSYVGDRLAERLGTRVEVGRVDFEFFRSLVLQEVLIEDQQSDTLLYFKKLSCSIDRILPNKNTFSFRDLELDGVLFDLKILEGEEHTNLQFILDQFATDGTDTTAKGGTFRTDEIEITDLEFRFYDANKLDSSSSIHFSDLNVKHMNLIARDVVVFDDTIRADVRTLNLEEKSGFSLIDLIGRATVSSQGLAVLGSHIETGNSKIHGDIVFEHDDYGAYKNFVNEVDLRCTFDSTSVYSGDLAYFVKALNGTNMRVGLAGKIRGTVSDLKARKLDLRFGRKSIFKGSVDMAGLPDIEETFMLVDVKQLRTNSSDLEQIDAAPFGHGKKLKMPKNLGNAGDINFRGNITGFVNDIVAYGTVDTDIGRLKTDMSFVRDTSDGDFTYEGRFIAERFDLGKFYANKNLGELSCNLVVDAHGTNINTLVADIEGTVGQLQFNEYDISSITVNGLFETKHFTGILECKDPNLEFIFNGEFDFNREDPWLEFEANIFHADLHALALVEGEGYSSLATRIGISTSLDLSNPNGSLSLEDFSYCNDDGQYDLGNAYFETYDHEDGKRFTLHSNIAHAEITGVYNAQEITGALRSIFYSVFPSMLEEVEYEQVTQNFSFELEMGESDRFFELILPDLRVASGSWLKGSVDTRTFDLEFDAYSASVTWQGKEVSGLELAMHKTSEIMAASIKAQKAMLSDSLFVDDLLITSKGYQNEFEALLDWRGSGLGANGRIELQGQIYGPSMVDIDLLPSQFDLKEQHWRTEETSVFKIDHREISIEGLKLTNGREKFMVEGDISEDPNKSLKMMFEDLHLSNFNVLLEKSGISLQGVLEGEASVSNVYSKNPLFLSYLCVDSLGLNEKNLGYLTLAAVWQNEEELIDLQGTLTNDNIKSLDLRGNIKPDDENSTLDLHADLNELDFSFLNALIPANITDIHGFGTGSISLAGQLSKPELSGSVFLRDGGLRVEELNTAFTFEHTINLYPGSITFDFIEAHDEEYREGRPGHKGVISGAINHNAFKDWNFDIFGELDNVLALNTTSSMNDLYYGVAYGSGEFNVFGYSENLEITVRAKTEKGTKLELPLSSSTEVSMHEFIRFVDKEPKKFKVVDQGPDLTGITMDLDLEVTPDADIELIFDETVGDILRGNGQGNIRMEIDPSGEFTMHGDYTVNEGDYLFTLQNILNKRFMIDKGGTIQWYGDPYAAILDLRTVYQTRTSLYDLMYDKREEFKKRVPVDVVMHLTNTLLDPLISFGIEVPTVSQEVRTMVETSINTEQEMSRQVFSLIVLNKFLPPPNGVQTAETTTGSVTASTTSEMLSNQVSNWLSKISDDFDIGFHYRPGDNVTENEVEVALSTQIFNDRVSINTNVGYQYGETSYTQNPNAIIGDFEVEVKLTEEGKLRAKVFNVSNDQDLANVNQAPTTQGVGLSYTEEFDNWPELMCKFKNIFKKKDKRMTCDPYAP